MYFKDPSKEINHEAEIRAYRRDAFSPSHMVSDQGITADKSGYKIVPVGTLVDKDGKVCKISGGAIEGTPVGITRHAVDVTNGPEPVAIFTFSESYKENLKSPLAKLLLVIFIYKSKV